MVLWNFDLLWQNYGTIGKNVVLWKNIWCHGKNYGTMEKNGTIMKTMELQSTIKNVLDCKNL